MKLHILAISHRLPHWASLASDDFLKRFPKGWACTTQELKPEARYGAKPDTAHIIDQEHERLMRAIPASHDIIIALDERGEQWSSMQWAKQLARWHDASHAACFIIGGADGLHPKMREHAHQVLALSSMTLPHALARVVLLEQLYRAVSIIQGHPYHREG